MIMNMRKTGLPIFILALAVLIVALIHFLASPTIMQPNPGSVPTSTSTGAVDQEQPTNITVASTSLQSSSSTSTASSSQFLDITVPNGVIHALVATSSADQEKGLGDRDSLPMDQGMLFIFPEQGSYGFWMKDMRFSLDMVWIGADKKVAGVASDISPSTYPDLFLPPYPISYVLELNAGQAKKYAIATGTALGF